MKPIDWIHTYLKATGCDRATGKEYVEWLYKTKKELEGEISEQERFEMYYMGILPKEE